MKKIHQTALIALIAVYCFVLVFSASAGDGALIAENLELTTYRGVSVGGRFTVADSGSEVIGFEITTPPSKGSVELSGDGCFVYTPDPGKKGKDYFGYKAIDADGAYSQEATVIIKIQKQKTRTTYSDMGSEPSAWAAVMLAEEGIFVGENLAGEYVFSPESPLTRAQFLTMCMRAADEKLIYDAAHSGFADDSSIESWARPYVTTALSRGYINGYATENGCVFAPNEPISALEAAVMLDNIMSFTDAVAVWYSYDDILPAWAVQSAANLASCGITPDGLSLLDDTLSRADGAEMLCRAMALADARR